MRAEDVRVGMAVWYLYRIPGLGLTGQMEAKVLDVKTKVKVCFFKNGGTAWVAAKSLRPTN